MFNTIEGTVNIALKIKQITTLNFLRITPQQWK